MARSFVTSVPPMTERMRSVFEAFGITSNVFSSNHQTMMSSATPPRSLHACVYWARPGAIFRRSFVSSRCRRSKAFAPSNRTVPRCETSKIAASVRHAMCSAMVPVGYDNGISHPPNGTIFAPSSRCSASSGDRRTSVIVLPQSDGCPSSHYRAMRRVVCVDAATLASREW